MWFDHPDAARWSVYLSHTYTYISPNDENALVRLGTSAWAHGGTGTALMVIHRICGPIF